MPLSFLNYSRRVLWAGSLALLGLAGVVYLLDPLTQRFETLYPVSGLRALLQPLGAAVSLPAPLRFWGPDFAWAAVTALFARELLQGLRLPAVGQVVCVVTAAMSWELLQAADVVGGVFDPRDLAASAAAGVLVWGLYRLCMRDVEVA